MEKINTNLDGLVVPYHNAGSLKEFFDSTLLRGLINIKNMYTYPNNVNSTINQCENSLKQIGNKFSLMQNYIGEVYETYANAENNVNNIFVYLNECGAGNSNFTPDDLFSLLKKIALEFNIASFLGKMPILGTIGYALKGATIITEGLFVGANRLVDTWNSDKDIGRKLADTGAVVVTSGLAIGIGIAIGTAIFPGVGTIAGAVIGASLGILASAILSDNVFKAVSDGIYNVGAAAVNGAKAIGSAANKLMESKNAAEVLKNVGGIAVEVGKTVCNVVVEAGKAVVNTVVEVGKSVVNAVVDTGKAIVNFFKSW